MFKKKDPTLTSNYRGISLSLIVAKVLASIVNSRLLVVSDVHVRKSQHGFTHNKGTVDALFALRQVVEKAREFKRPLFAVFVDFRKAYDSVPREVLWKVLTYFGVPVPLLNVHNGNLAIYSR